MSVQVKKLTIKVHYCYTFMHTALHYKCFLSAKCTLTLERMNWEQIGVSYLGEGHFDTDSCEVISMLKQLYKSATLVFHMAIENSFIALSTFRSSLISPGVATADGATCLIWHRFYT